MFKSASRVSGLKELRTAPTGANQFTRTMYISVLYLSITIQPVHGPFTPSIEIILIRMTRKVNNEISGAMCRIRDGP